MICHCPFQQLTLLHWAADRGHEHLIRLLVKYGAKLNVQDEDGQTPLFYGKFFIVRSILFLHSHRYI